MVLLHRQLPSRKRPPSSSASSSGTPKIHNSQPSSVATDATEKMVAILAEAGCTLINPTGLPYLPSDYHKFRRQLTRLLSGEDSVAVVSLSNFVSGFSSYIESPKNLLRVLSSSTCDRNDSLVRNLLLVPPIQLDIQNMLLEKLPEYFGVITETSLAKDVARLIVNHFRWLDFIVDPNAFADRLMQVLSICPLHLKKEIIGSLPEIIGDLNSKSVVDSLERMLQEDSAIVVPMLDSLSNLNLDDQLQEQVITIALSCIRTIEAEHMPYLLRFLLLSATTVNARRIISQIREQLKFIGISKSLATQNKLKGKLPLDNTEASILHALRSSFRFKNILCQEIVKELSCLTKPQDHKVIDIWLLMTLYMNEDPLRKSIEKIFKKKVVEECIQVSMLDQCIRGNKELVQDYFSAFLSLAEYLLACKEQKARAFGTHVYTCLFEEFTDDYSRQEILGGLVTHVGSSVTFEVCSALETMILLTTKYPQEMLSFSSHISGILDYLEGFTLENLHKVYEVFSILALSARTSAHGFKNSIANELLMIVRKQISHPDLKYKRMGLIGTLKIVSCLGSESNCEDALELLKTSLDSCKQSCLPLILFYDELTALLDHKTLHPEIMEWIGKHVGEFESLFLSDLEGGKLCNKEDSYSGLEGELWMNLDGDISPICLNILPLASSSLQSVSSLQILPSNFLLLSTVERLTNKGSLAGIDALLGCPLHLPSSKYFTCAGWQSLTGKQRQVVCLSLYYAANYIRELLNAFSTQVNGRFECVSQASKDDIVTKLWKRLGNLVFLESLLHDFIKLSPLSLPELHLHVDHSGSLAFKQPSYMGHLEKKTEKRKTCDNASQNKKKGKKTSKTSTSSDVTGKYQQPTILEVLRKAGVNISQEENADSSTLPSMGTVTKSTEQQFKNSNESIIVEIAAVGQPLEGQRSKFRTLMCQCFSILTLPKNQDKCDSDRAAELPLYLYLLRDFHDKLDYFSPPGKPFSPRCSISQPGLGRIPAEEFISNIGLLFSSLKTLLDSAIGILKEGNETCQKSWTSQSAAAGNPNMHNVVLSESSVSKSVFKEILICFSKMLNLDEIQKEKLLLSNLLEAFQPSERPNFGSQGLPPPSPGTIEYLYLGACFFLEDVFNVACSFSFSLASESLLTLESVTASLQKYFGKVLEANGRNMPSQSIHGFIPILNSRLGISAQTLLKHDWSDESLEKGWKNKGEVVQKILRIYLETSESTSDLLNELACNVLPQVPLSTPAIDEVHHSFSSLCPATFVGWYRVLHEVNLKSLNNLVKEVCYSEKQQGFPSEAVETHLTDIHKTVNVVVSLVNMCRTHDKVTVRALAVKYGGKFVDSFLKVFNFLQAHFESHNELVIQLVKELQKATRTLQTLCSEAKGLKQTIITGKIPATKRSLERFLFHVKALLHTSNGCTFWMGNLKHKDLTGQIVSSQAYMDSNQNNTVDEDPHGSDSNQNNTVDEDPHESDSNQNNIVDEDPSNIVDEDPHGSDDEDQAVSTEK